MAKAVIHTIKLNGIVFVHVITSSDICPNNNIVVKSNFTTMPVLQNGGYIWEMMELTHCSQPNGLIDDNCEIKFSKKTKWFNNDQLYESIIWITWIWPQSINHNKYQLANQCH